MSMHLSACIMRDDGSDISLSLDDRVEGRIIQEELWSQTAWPDGEPTLADVIAVLEDPRTKRAISLLVELRKQLPELGAFDDDGGEP